MDGSGASSEPDAIVHSFTTFASLFGSIYGCGYLLDGWSLSGGTLMSNMNTSDMSPVPKTSRWLGIPPGRPWIAWFGRPYSRAIKARDDIATTYPDGVLVRRSGVPIRDRDPGPSVDVPTRYLVRRADPRVSLSPTRPPKRARVDGKRRGLATSSRLTNGPN